MPLTPVKTPRVVKQLFSNYVWGVPTTDKVIYLTFDDGPTPKITDWTLNILKQYNAQATFFCIGNNVEKHPEIFNTILEHGHAIGNHTQNHVKGWQSKTEAYLKTISGCESIFKSEGSNSNTVNRKSLVTNLFRPPYGQITPKQGKQLIQLGYKIIMWDVLSFDWNHAVTKEKCLENVVTKTTPGSIIVFHDSVKASRNMQYTLPKVLAHFSKKGYTFKALDTAI